MEASIKDIQTRFMEGTGHPDSPPYTAHEYRADVGYLLNLIERMKKEASHVSD